MWIVIILLAVALLLIFIYLKSKKDFQKTYEGINHLKRSELVKIIDDLVCYAVWSSDTPNKMIPIGKRKYGCIKYKDAEKLYNTAVKRHNALLAQEQENK